MIRSMTAFGAGSVSLPQGHVTVDIRSVNSRFLDLTLRVPDDLRHLDTDLRSRLHQQLHRGKVELRANLTRTARVSPTDLDLDALREAVNLLDAVRAVVPETPAPRLNEWLNWPGVQSQPLQPDLFDNAVREATDTALTQLQAAREREGQRLADILTERADQIDTTLAELVPQLPTIQQAWRERVGQKLRDAITQAFPGGVEHINAAELTERLTQETALFSLRIDVEEEMARLRAHLAELRDILAGRQPRRRDTGAGKRLDFLLQEMNREANTLGSKAGALAMTHAAIDLKLLIEQLREQVQNIE